MDVEQAMELCRSIDSNLNAELAPSIYDDEVWERIEELHLRADVTEEDADHILSADADFGLVMVEPFTKYVVPRSVESELRPDQWINGQGEIEGYVPSKLMTRGLAQAQRHLLAVEDVPPDLRRLIDETLDLIHEALAALDYTPESPLLLLAAEQ